MNEDPTTAPRTSDSDARGADAKVVAATHAWLRNAVIGLNLCPFAKLPYAQQRVRLRVSRAQDEDALIADLGEELLALHAADADVCETTLLIHPGVLDDFFEYNDFLEVADALLQELGLEGELQVASFHPDYQFADASAEAIENCTNRSPYPMLHLLREESVQRAVESVADTAEITRRNIATLRALGLAGWRALMRKP